MNEHTLIGSILVLIPTILHGLERAYLKAKSLDPNVPNPKPFYKTSEFYLKLGTALVGALEIFNGQVTP